MQIFSWMRKIFLLDYVRKLKVTYIYLIEINFDLKNAWKQKGKEKKKR